MNSKGFSLVEIVISFAILAFVMLGVATFQGKIFGLNVSLSNELAAQTEGRKFTEQFTAQLRETESADTGAYPLANTEDAKIIFYSNIDGDGDVERVRYEMVNGALVYGIINPTGNPPVYNTANETTVTMVSHIVNGATPLFAYYDENYNGNSSPLAVPVTPSEVRYVGITLIIDKDVNRPPAPFVMSSGVNLRNVKDNL